MLIKLRLNENNWLGTKRVWVLIYKGVQIWILTKYVEYMPLKYHLLGCAHHQEKKMLNFIDTGTYI